MTLINNTRYEIYGGKKAYDYPSALIELGGEIYGKGPIGPSSYIFGETNPVDNQFALGVRYQKALDSAWIFRADAMAAVRDNDEESFNNRFNPVSIEQSTLCKH